MPPTAEGVFRIIDRASQPITKITTAGEKMDKTIKGAGKSLDQLDSPQVTNSIKTTQRNTEGLGRTVEQTGIKIGRTTTRVGNDFKKMSASGQASIAELTQALKRFEHERATATMDVNIAKAEAKIRLVKHELRTLTTAEARKELDLLGLSASSATAALAGGGGMAGGGGGGPPFGGGIRGGLAGGFLSAGGRAAFMGTALAALLPVIVSVTGAVSALIGSLGAAAGGAGALGVGTLGAFAVGIGSIVAVAKPAHATLKELKKAQDDYNKSVQQYGKDSAQAAAAQRTLTEQQKKNPLAASVVRNQKVLGQRWAQATGPARNDYFGILNEGLKTANALLPTFGRNANRILSSTRRAVEDFLRPFRGQEWRGIFRDLGDTFARLIGPAARGLGNIGLFFGRVSRAASPMVIRMFDALEDWTGGLARNVGNRERTTRTVERLVGHLKDWVDMGGSAVKLMATFFGAGAQQGQSIVQGITEQFDKWTVWLQRHPGEVQDFFERTIASAEKLVTAVGNIARILGEVGDAMLPLLDGFSEMVNLAGGAGLLGPAMLLGGARLAMGRGFGLGRGGGGGAAGGSGVVAGAAGGAAAGGARGVIGGIRDRYAIGRAYGGSGAVGAMGGMGRAGAARGALSGVGGTALRGAGRVAAPLAAGMALWDFATYRGNVAERGQAALSGATLGLVPRPTSDKEGRAAGQNRATEWLGGGRRTGDIEGQMGHLERLLGEKRNYGGSSILGTKNDVVTKLQGGARADVQAQLDALKPVLKAQVQIEQSNKAMKSMDSLISAFDDRWSRLGSKKAGTGFIQGLTRQLRALGPVGDRELLHATAAWSATLEDGTKAQQRQAQRVKNAVVREYREMGRDVRVIEGNIVDISKGKWASVRKAITSETELAAQEGRKAFTELQRAAVGALRNMGYGPKEARGIIGGMDADASKSSRAATAAALESGPGSYDSGVAAGTRAGPPRPVKAGPPAPSGDGMGIIDGPAGDGIGNNGRSAWARQTKGRGRSAPGRGGGLMGANAGLGVYATDAARFGLRVSSGARPGAITSYGNRSHHASGNAIDLAGSPAAMMAFARHAAQTYGSRLEELIYSPMGFSIKNGKRTAPYAVGDHYDHVHIADTAPGGGINAMAGGAGGGNWKAPRRRSRARGAAGAMSNAVTAAIATGLEQRVNAATPAGAFGALPPASAGGAAGAAAGGNWGALLAQYGLPSIFNAIIRAESGGNPRARNASGATGLTQIMWPLHRGIVPGATTRAALEDPAINLAAASVLFRQSGLAPWAASRHAWGSAQGDGIGDTRMKAPVWGGWHAKGGEFVARRPTVIGVGEAGAERIKIGPQSGSGSKGVTLLVKIDKFVNNTDEDVEELFDKLAAKLADELDRGGDDDELDG